LVVSEQHQQQEAQLVHCLQYWIICSMMTCIQRCCLALPLIGTWFFRSTGSNLKNIHSTTAHGIILHLEFYIYMSLYIIPKLTPVAVQKLDQYRTVYDYYIHQHIAPCTVSIYDQVSSCVSMTTYHTYVIEPCHKLLQFLLWSSVLSNETYHTLYSILQEGRSLMVPTLLILSALWPIQRFCIIYVAYVIPIAKCCTVLLFQHHHPQEQHYHDSYSNHKEGHHPSNDSNHRSSKNSKNNVTTGFTCNSVPPPPPLQHERTVVQWLQFWILHMGITMLVQSVSSIIWWIPFSNVMIYGMYMYWSVMASPSIIEYMYVSYIHNEIQSWTTTTTTTHSPSKLIQLWNYIYRILPKAATNDADDHVNSIDSSNNNNNDIDCSNAMQEIDLGAVVDTATDNNHQ
jgi:hypothetical protein